MRSQGSAALQGTQMCWLIVQQGGEHLSNPNTQHWLAFGDVKWIRDNQASFFWGRLPGRMRHYCFSCKLSMLGTEAMKRQQMCSLLCFIYSLFREWAHAKLVEDCGWHLWFWWDYEFPHREKFSAENAHVSPLGCKASSSNPSGLGMGQVPFLSRCWDTGSPEVRLQPHEGSWTKRAMCSGPRYQFHLKMFVFVAIKGIWGAMVYILCP